MINFNFGVNMRKLPPPVIGTVYGQLTVISDQWESVRGINHARLRCSCGVEKLVSIYSLRKGLTTSCGCYRALATRQRKSTHGCSGTSEYEIWSGIRTRVTNSDRDNYKDYGGRGIGLCDRWEKFENFLADIGPRPSAEHSLDRRDNNLGYSPDNCYWATPTQQANNRRDSTRFMYRGRLYSLVELSELSGIGIKTLSSRLYAYSWTVEDAVNLPIGSHPNVKAKAEILKLYTSEDNDGSSTQIQPTQD